MLDFVCEGESFKTTRNRSYWEGMSQITFLFKSFNNIFFALPGRHEANLPCSNWRRPQKQTRSFLQTRSSPAAIDEVIHELCDNSSQSSTCITHRETRVCTILVLLFWISFSSLVAAKKRKRASSNTSQSAQISDPNRSSQSPLPFGTRLSTPTMIESKNTRKRRLRQERRQQKGGPAVDSVSSTARSSFSAHSIRHGSNLLFTTLGWTCQRDWVAPAVYHFSATLAPSTLSCLSMWKSLHLYQDN